MEKTASNSEKQTYKCKPLSFLNVAHKRVRTLGHESEVGKNPGFFCTMRPSQVISFLQICFFRTEPTLYGTFEY